MGKKKLTVTLKGYVRALYTLESHRRVASPAVAATGGSLVIRVRRLLLSNQVAAPLDRRVPWLAGLIALAVLSPSSRSAICMPRSLCVSRP
jgi:hypothetical protein